MTPTTDPKVQEVKERFDKAYADWPDKPSPSAIDFVWYAEEILGQYVDGGSDDGLEALADDLWELQGDGADTAAQAAFVVARIRAHK